MDESPEPGEDLAADETPPASPKPRSSCCAVGGVFLVLAALCVLSGLAVVAFQYPLRRSLAVFDTKIRLAVEGDDFEPEGVSHELQKRFRRHGILAAVSFEEGEIVVLMSSSERTLADPILAGSVDFRILAEAAPDALSEEARASEIARIQAAQAAGTWDPLQDAYATYPWHQQAYGAENPPILLSTKDMLEASDFARFEVTTDGAGRPALGFRTSASGAKVLHRLSEASIGRRLAIVLGGEVRSAPMVRAAISKRGIVEGGQQGWTRTEVEALVIQLESGKVPWRLRILEEAQVSPGQPR